jgi:hypothetical protein
MEEMIIDLLQKNAAWWDRYYSIKTIDTVSDPLESTHLRLAIKP